MRTVLPFGVAMLATGLTWLCSFLGPVFVIYGMRHNTTLTNYEGVGCILMSLPPTIIVLLLISRDV